MGIRPIDALVLAKNFQMIPQVDSLLTLGTQKFMQNGASWRRLAATYDIPLRAFEDSDDGTGALKAVDFFKSLGVKEIFSLDVSDYESSDFIFNLNEAECPSTLKQKFDLVFDGGTMEHVFHIPNFLQNIASMIKVNGHIVHSCPANGWLDHGFYQISPTLLLDYYSQNNWTVVSSNLLLSKPGQNLSVGYTCDSYRQTEMQSVWGKFERANVHVCVQKTASSGVSKIPTQGYYASIYGNSTEKNLKYGIAVDIKLPKHASKLGLLKRFIKSVLPL